MKILRIASLALLAIIDTAPRAHARISIPNMSRDPRTVEIKEEVQRQTVGELVLDSILAKDAGGQTCEQRLNTSENMLLGQGATPEEAKSLACSGVSKVYPNCRGCQGYGRTEKEVRIPGCVGMASGECVALAEDIVKEKSIWFKDGANTKLVPEEHVVADTDTYYALALPVPAEGVKPRVIQGLADDCMVHYSWDWCVNDRTGDVKCIKIGPFDCSDHVNGGCLNSDDCCTMIQDGKYPAPDINQKSLQCYEWEIPSKSSNGSEGIIADGGGSEGNVGSAEVNHVNRLIIHLSNDKVALPAVITDVLPAVATDGLGGIVDEESKAEGQIALGSNPGMCLEYVEADNQYNGLTLSYCKHNRADQLFSQDASTMQIKHVSSGKCLVLHLMGVIMKDCVSELATAVYTGDNHEMTYNNWGGWSCLATYAYGDVSQEGKFQYSILPCDGTDNQKFITSFEIAQKPSA